MGYSAKAVANYFLARGEEEGVLLDPMKLQKLLYFAHGWSWGMKDKRLLNETIEAWKYGPVVRSVYHEFSEFGNKPITRRANRLKVGDDGSFQVTTPVISQDDVETREFLRSVWDVYKKHSGITLSNATHEAGTPWEQTVREHKGDLPKGLDIPDDTIQAYFKEKAQAHGK